jgi:tetratricopeptide (TPR) repeat protein
MRVRAIFVLCAFIFEIGAVAQTPGADELNRAYQAFAKRDYDAAIDLFRKGLLQQPANQGAHKDLAYTLLKAGENADARDEFALAAKLNPKDDTASLEYAFLAYETKQPIEARRTFDRLRHSANPATRATAEQAFQNIDRPLGEGIARWKDALARAAHPDDLAMYSAHWELAQLAELRDELPLAAEQYEICRKLKPQLSELLLILARVWAQLDRREDAHAALLAAARSNNSRTAELALEQMDSRYPYPYEFVNAIRIDPQNPALHRELGYLYLAMATSTS